MAASGTTKTTTLAQLMANNAGGAFGLTGVSAASPATGINQPELNELVARVNGTTIAEWATNGYRLVNGTFFGWGSGGAGVSLHAINSPDVAFGRNAAGVIEVNAHSAGVFRDIIYRNYATGAAAPTIASAATIAPTVAITFVSGVAAIGTITVPAPISTSGGTITFIPTGLFTWGAAGNIAIAGSAVVSKALTFTFDVTSTKWYPSYTA